MDYPKILEGILESLSKQEELNTMYGYEQYTKKENEYFLIIGVEIPGENEGEKQFVSLPVPISLDGMRENQVKGTGPYQESLLKGNDLLKQLQELARANLQPGEEITLNELTVKIRRRKQQQQQNHTSRTFNFTIRK